MHLKKTKKTPRMIRIIALMLSLVLAFFTMTGMAIAEEGTDVTDTAPDSTPEIVEAELELEPEPTEELPAEAPGTEKSMIEKGRYSKIDSVFEYFIGLVKEEKKIGIAYIATAVELSEAQKEAVMQRLLQTTKYESFEMNYQVDASLIGGMVIRIGDRVVDTSIKTKLYELSKSPKKIQV